jgi:hypothetical protein
MNDRLHPARHELDFARFADITLSNLGNCYSTLKPGAQAEDFIREILNIVGIMDDPAVETPIEIIMQFVSASDKAKGPEWIASSPYGSLIVSCAYCLRAMRASKAGNQELAWSYMADARYWCGVSISSKGIAGAQELTRRQATDEALVKQGQSGADARNETYNLLRQYVYEQARKPGKSWQSRSYAAEVISKAALTYIREEKASAEAEGRPSKLPLPRSEQGFKRTVDSWLRDMPDALSLFPAKNSKN